MGHGRALSSPRSLLLVFTLLGSAQGLGKDQKIVVPRICSGRSRVRLGAGFAPRAVPGITRRSPACETLLPLLPVPAFPQPDPGSGVELDPRAARRHGFLLRQQRDLAVLLTPELIPAPGGPTHLGSPESGIGARGETPTVAPTLSVLNISHLQQELPVSLQVLLRLLVMELQNAFSRPQGVWSLHD